MSNKQFALTATIGDMESLNIEYKVFKGRTEKEALKKLFKYFDVEYEIPSTRTSIEYLQTASFENAHDSGEGQYLGVVFVGALKHYKG